MRDMCERDMLRDGRGIGGRVEGRERLENPPNLFLIFLITV